MADKNIEKRWRERGGYVPKPAKAKPKKRNKPVEFEPSYTSKADKAMHRMRDHALRVISIQLSEDVRNEWPNGGVIRSYIVADSIYKFTFWCEHTDGFKISVEQVVAACELDDPHVLQSVGVVVGDEVARAVKRYMRNKDPAKYPVPPRSKTIEWKTEKDYKLPKLKEKPPEDEDGERFPDWGDYDD